MKKLPFIPTSCLCACLLALLFAFGGVLWAPVCHAAPYTPDDAYLQDRAALDELQRAAFAYIWEDGDPHSGMAYEVVGVWDSPPIAVGGTGFGIAAIVVAVDRGWIGREEALQRLLRICLFLRDKSPRKELHGAFPHWLDPHSGAILSFGKNDDGADIVETSLLMQGLLIARAYFNGPGTEEKLRDIITGLWEDVDWNWFTNNEERGIYWHWSQQKGFSMGLKILGYNECLITYVLAASSPTHPISRAAYDYWTSGKGYKPKDLYGYRVEASLSDAGPLFLTHYSFIGLDPRRLADAFVPGGYFVRNCKQTLSNRAYCLYYAPAKNRYSEQCWGLSASQIKDGYAASSPGKDTGTISPTGALSSMPYTPHYSLQFLHFLRGKLRNRIWGKNGPFDGFSLRDGWYSRSYLAIDQLPIVCMVENYRSGLLWAMLMSDADVRRGLELAGLHEPEFGTGFPEMVVTLVREGKKNLPDACDLRRHPDSGLYQVPYWCVEAGQVQFTISDPEGGIVYKLGQNSVKGRNLLSFPQFMRPDEEILTLTMRTASGEEHSLP
ncbi:hypothetical protein LJC59_08735, partial [Desulfovibrio sp. OttesenSCG-928-A18]|nr:hypothetical protein [Desulfovibrio sp. OttesenSCG-928-A18]